MKLQINSVTEEHDHSVVIGLSEANPDSKNPLQLCAAIYGPDSAKPLKTVVCPTGAGGTLRSNCIVRDDAYLPRKAWVDLYVTRGKNDKNDKNSACPSADYAFMELPVETIAGGKEHAANSEGKYKIVETHALLGPGYLLVRVKFTGKGPTPTVYLDGSVSPALRTSKKTDNTGNMTGEILVRVPDATSRHVSTRTVWVGLGDGKKISATAEVTAHR